MGCQPKSLQQALLPLSVIGKVLGLVEVRFRGSRLSLWYSLVCVICLLASMGVCIGHPETFRLLTGTKSAKVTFNFLFYGNGVVTVVAMALAKYGAKGVRDLTDRLTELEDIMEKSMGLGKNYQEIFRKCTICAIVFIVKVAILGIVNGKCLVTDDPNYCSLLCKLSNIFALLYPVLVTGFLDIWFACHIRILGDQFRAINGRLRGLLTTTPDSPQHKRVLEMTDIGLNGGMPLREQLKRRTNDDVDLMKRSRQIHLELVRTSRGINDLFGMQVMLSMIEAFVAITGLLYNCYNAIFWSVDSTSDENRSWLIGSTVWLPYHVCKIWICSHFCAETSQEAKKTGDVICELYEPMTSKEFRTEISHFTLQLVQNPLSFSAYGLFALDYTFIHNVIVTITTYLVILIQMADLPQPEFSPETTTASSTERISNGDETFLYK